MGSIDQYWPSPPLRPVRGVAKYMFYVYRVNARVCTTSVSMASDSMASLTVSISVRQCQCMTDSVSVCRTVLDMACQCLYGQYLID